MKKFIKMLVVMSAAVMMLSMAACGKKSVIGTWSCTENNVTTTYVFNEDGTGTMDIGSGIVLNIQYKTDKDKLTVEYSMLGKQNSIEYTYLIEKNALTLSDSSASITLTKQTS